MKRLVLGVIFALAAAPLFAQAPTVSRYWLLDVGTVTGQLTIFKVNSNGAMLWHSGGHTFVYRNCSSTDIGSLGGGITFGRQIGPDGSVVGSSRNAAGKMRAFRFANGVMRDLGGGETAALIVEDAKATNYWGDVVGVESVQGGLAATAVRYQDGGAWPMAPIFDGGAFNRVSNIVDMNDSRQVLGSFRPVTGGLKTVLSSNLGYQWTTVRGVAGLDSITTPMAMNRYGHITGAAGEPTTRAFLSRNTALPATDLGTLGGALSVGIGINNYDFVVGTADPAPLPRVPQQMHAFVHDGTGMIDLNARLWNGAGWVLREAFAINDAGVIVGEGLLNGVVHAFMLLPRATYPLVPPCQPIVVGGVFTVKPN